MSLPLDSIYQQIGNSVAGTLEAEWLKVEVLAEISPEVLSFEGYYYFGEPLERRKFLVSRDTVKLFKQLHARMSESPKGNWKRAKFEMQQDGTFDIKFAY